MKLWFAFAFAALLFAPFAGASNATLDDLLAAMNSVGSKLDQTNANIASLNSSIANLRLNYSSPDYGSSFSSMQSYLSSLDASIKSMKQSTESSQQNLADLILRIDSLKTEMQSLGGKIAVSSQSKREHGVLRQQQRERGSQRIR